MKTCNNCDTNNELAAVKCIGCHMPGNFTHHTMTSEEIPTEEVQNAPCTNCGTTHPGDGTNCIQCRFPIDRARVKTIPKPMALHLFRKAV